MQKFAVLVLVGVFGGCGGGGPSEPKLTIGQVCLQVADALCERMVQCGQIGPGDYDGCTGATVGGCCSQNGICAQGSPVTQSQFMPCVNAFASEQCGAVALGTIPATCQILD